MAVPTRNSRTMKTLGSARCFFVTAKTSMGRALLQTERNALLLIAVIRSYARAGKFEVHDFVVMPNHLHLLMTVGSEMTIEKAVQLVKGGFSYRLKKETGYDGEVWQRGFSEVRVMDSEHRGDCQEYIAHNPVKAGLVSSPEAFPFCYRPLAMQKAAGAKARQ
ncbi:MAG TPA: hypothetical protein DGA22_16130 [Acidobacterium sp.]|uniref:Conserved domain protein n=2 Tax=Acidobacteriaceae TaxID=204434 RepID=C1FAE9_ACIC5|nr:conserved domain protein [Acidobacterium capsulatum ATCC 51196]HCT62383.1 hypothetical protein [Acidobacterium sp.]